MPNRTIKESALTSRTLDTLSDGAERLFWRLTVVADDYGRFDAEPSVVLARCFPLRIGRLKISTVNGWIAELVTAGLMDLYQIADRLYGAFKTWAKHQGKPRANHSKYPEPTTETMLSTDTGKCQASADRCSQMPANVPVVDFRSSSRKNEVERTNTRENARAREEGAAGSPLTPLAALWNQKCPGLPRVLSVTAKWREKERLRLTHRPLEEWGAIFERINASSFCRGESAGDRKWVATYDWIIANNENGEKVLQGKYDDRAPSLAEPKGFAVLRELRAKEGKA